MNRRLLNILIPADRGKRKRLLIDVLLVAVLFGGYFWYTHWAPAHKMESEHYMALSNASIEDTEDRALQMTRLVDLLHEPEPEAEEEIVRKPVIRVRRGTDMTEAVIN